MTNTERGDVITNVELQTLFNLIRTIERIGGNIAKRIDSGAKVVRGPMVIEMIDGEPGDRPNIMLECCDVLAGPLRILPRKQAHYVLGKPIRRRKAA